MNKAVVIVVSVLLVIGIATRFIFIIDGQSVLPNFTAIGAIALFGANYLKGSLRFILPFAVLWLSDLVLNNVVYKSYYESIQFYGSPWVYLSFALAILIGIYLMRKPTWSRLIGAAILSGLAFYLVTNFAVWMNPSSPYAKNAGGLLLCYEAALPFFRNTLLGNLFYSFVLFGAYEYFAQHYVALRTSRQLSTV